MILSSDTYARLERHFAEWSLAQASIAAVIVVGSRARAVHPADDWSDLDLVVFASDTAPYLRHPAWLNTFGVVIAAVSNPFGQNDREWIALYADGVKIDVAFLAIDLAATPTLQTMLDAFPYPNVLQRGARALVDKTRASTELRLPEIGTPGPPAQAEFTTLTNRMWLDALKAAKFIRRHDVWRAKQLCDGEMKQHLLTMLEWHAAVRQNQHDIWYDGRFLDEWADPQAVAELPATFATYEEADLPRALFATLALFRRLARDVAQLLGYSDLIQTEQFAYTYIRSLL